VIPKNLKNKTPIKAIHIVGHWQLYVGVFAALAQREVKVVDLF